MAKNKCTPFGVKIKTRLIEKGMSNKELATLVGYTTSTISDVIYGRNSCPVTREAIARTLGIVADLQELEEADKLEQPKELEQSGELKPSGRLGESDKMKFLERS